LEPEHLPKHERIAKTSFLIVRAYDEKCVEQADTVQELTRKVAIFLGDSFLISVHRVDQPYLTQLRQRWKANGCPDSPNPGPMVLGSLLMEVLHSYDKPIGEAQQKLETLEGRIFRSESDPTLLQECYIIKRKASVFRRILKLTMDILSRLHSNLDTHSPFFQDIREEAESLYFYADELHESVTTLLNLHISLSSQHTNEASFRTNEIMRVLTVLSVCFMPLNLIAGIYGMNFESIPELKMKYGYPFALALMVGVGSVILLWFNRKGWLR
jgi:magnesium transporter